VQTLAVSFILKINGREVLLEGDFIGCCVAVSFRTKATSIQAINNGRQQNILILNA